MLKFEFNHLQKTLYIQPPGSPRQPITKTFATNWGAPSFILEPANHWITFTIYPTKIRAFYKQVQISSPGRELEQITYYQKDLPKTNPISFTFEKPDQVHKVDGRWVEKTNHEM